MPKRPLGNTALVVLAALAQGCRYGFDIMDHASLKSGSVYRALARLEELGLARSRWEAATVAVQEKRPRRRYYEITAAGVRELETTRRSLEALATRLAPSERG